MKQLFLDFFNRVRSTWTVFPVILGLFFFAGASEFEERRMQQICSKAYTTYIDLKRRPLVFEPNKAPYKADLKWITDAEFKVIEEEAERAKKACESSASEVRSEQAIWDILGWIVIFIGFSSMLYSVTHSEDYAD